MTSTNLTVYENEHSQIRYRHKKYDVVASYLPEANQATLIEAPKLLSSVIIFEQQGEAELFFKRKRLQRRPAFKFSDFLSDSFSGRQLITHCIITTAFSFFIESTETVCHRERQHLSSFLSIFSFFIDIIFHTISSWCRFFFCRWSSS